MPGSSWWGCHGFAGRGLLLGELPEEGHLGHWHRADAERRGWPLTLGGESHGVTSAGEGEVQLDGASRLDEPISTSHHTGAPLRGTSARVVLFKGSRALDSSLIQDGLVSGAWSIELVSLGCV